MKLFTMVSDYVLILLFLVITPTFKNAREVGISLFIAGVLILNLLCLWRIL